MSMQSPSSILVNGSVSAIHLGNRWGILVDRDVISVEYTEVESIFNDSEAGVKYGLNLGIFYRYHIEIDQNTQSIVIVIQIQSFLWGLFNVY